MTDLAVASIKSLLKPQFKLIQFNKTRPSSQYQRSQETVTLRAIHLSVEVFRKRFSPPSFHPPFNTHTTSSHTQVLPHLFIMERLIVLLLCLLSLAVAAPQGNLLGSPTANPDNGFSIVLEKDPNYVPKLVSFTEIYMQSFLVSLFHAPLCNLSLVTQFQTTDVSHCPPVLKYHTLIRCRNMVRLLRMR